MSQLNRIAWIVTVGLCLLTALILVLSGYTGYAGVTLAVAIAAAINLKERARAPVSGTAATEGEGSGVSAARPRSAPPSPAWRERL